MGGGANLPAEDMMILGVLLGNTFDSVKACLGQPTKETSRGNILMVVVTFGNLKNGWGGQSLHI